MCGYLGKPAKTADVPHNRWYTTGEVGMIEEDGFVTITDRLSRFSKIGGQMVPHIRIEGKLHALADATEQVFTVTAVPDEGIEPDAENTGAGAGSSYVIDPLCSPSASLFMATSTDGSPDG